jgi:ABC-2 type transport system permease protein
MKNNIRFIKLLFKLKLQKQMMYPLSFFGVTIVDGIIFLLWLLMFKTIYSQVDSIGGWSQGQTMIFLGTFSLLNAINMTIYFFGVFAIPEKIRDGELDYYLTKPVNPLLRLTFENINIGSAPLILLSIGIIVYGLRLTGISVSAGTGLLYVFFIFLMAVLYYDMEVIIRTFPFFFISVDSIQRIEMAALDLCMRMPGVLFKGIFKVLFYFLLPYGIMATIPSQILTSTANWEIMIISVGVVLVFTIFTQCFWYFGLRHYKSASS